MAALVEVPEDVKRKLCKMRVDQWTYDQIAEALEENGFNYTNMTIGRFFNSEEGEKMLRGVREELAEEWKEEPLAEKFSRVHALVEQATRLRRQLRVLNVEDKAFKKLSEEFRQYLKQIREEMEPLQLAVTTDHVSPFDQMDEWIEENLVAIGSG